MKDLVTGWRRYGKRPKNCCRFPHRVHQSAWLEAWQALDSQRRALGEQTGNSHEGRREQGRNPETRQLSNVACEIRYKHYYSPV